MIADLLTEKLDKFFEEALADRDVTTRPYVDLPQVPEPDRQLFASKLVAHDAFTLTSNEFWKIVMLPLARALDEAIPRGTRLAVPPVPAGAIMSGQGEYVRWLIHYDFELASDRLTLSVYA